MLRESEGSKGRQVTEDRDNILNTTCKYINETMSREFETICELSEPMLLIQKPSLFVILSSQKICETIPFTLSFVKLMSSGSVGNLAYF